jgi:DNA-directed RNA polymerase specialized sigma24 family protein
MAGRTIGATVGRLAENPGEAPDDEILKLLDQRSPLGIELLYDKCGARIYSIALALVRDEATAEQLTMKAFVGVWRGARPSSRCTSVGGWMAATVLRDARRMSA